MGPRSNLLIKEKKKYDPKSCDTVPLSIFAWTRRWPRSGSMFAKGVKGGGGIGGKRVEGRVQ